MAGNNNESLSTQELDVFEPIKEEIESFKNDVENNVNKVDELSRHLPKGFSRKLYNKKVINLNLSDNNIENLINQIPEGKRPLILYEAAVLKDNFNGKISDKDAIQYTISGQDKSDLHLKFLETKDIEIYNILKIVYKAIDDGDDPFLGLKIPSNIIFGDKNIIDSIDKENRVLYFDKLPQNIQKEILSGIEKRYSTKFKKHILKSLEDDPETNPVSLFNNEEIFRIYVRYYNVGLLREGKKPLNLKSLSEGDILNLKESFKVYLKILGCEVDNVDDGILNELLERENREREENQKLLEEYMKRTRELNNAASQQTFTNENILTKSNEKMVDIQKASGKDIAENAGLGKKLNEKYNNNKNNEESDYNEQAISIARSNFIKSHIDLKNYITEELFLSLYDKNINAIKSLDNEAWDGLKKIFQNDPDKLTNIYKQISALPGEISKTEEELSKDSRLTKLIINEDENNKAVGLIIDNIRNIFSEEQKGADGNIINKRLKLNNKNPVSIDGDFLKISGNFDGADVLIRYNLKTGEIYINSLLQYDESNSRMIIGDNSVTKVGQILTFDKILDNNELINSQINSLNEIIVKNSKKQSYTNSIVKKFMRTFNITQDNNDTKNIILDKGSNLFNVFNVIRNTDSIDTIKDFQKFMGIVMDYACLIWGENNLLGSQKDQSKGNKYDITFNENNKNEYLLAIRESANIFSKDPSKLLGTENIKSDYKLGFADLIMKYITTDDNNEHNKKLDSSKMKDFINHLETDNKET